MFLYIMKENELLDLKRDRKIEENLNYYTKPTNDWLNQEYGQTIFQKYGKKLENIDLIMDEKEKPYKNDIENAKIIYSSLKDLSDSNATDERLWSGLTHKIFWKYMRFRWPLEKKTETKKRIQHIKERYFFNEKTGLTRTIFFNGISRLWWYARLTFDEARENKYELLDYLGRDINVLGYVLFAGYRYSSNHDILKELITGLMNFERKYGIKIKKRDYFRQIFIKINLLGGDILLDFIAKKGLIKNKVEEYLKEKYSKEIQDRQI